MWDQWSWCELEVVNKAITNAYHKACPERKISGRKVPWWSRELTWLRKKANKAFHTAYRSRLDSDWLAYREARRAFKKELRCNKCRSWQTFCISIEGSADASRLYKALGKSNIGPPGVLKLPDGRWTGSLEETYEHLLMTHFPGCKLADNGNNCQSATAMSRQNKWIPPTNWTVAESVVTYDRIKWAISTMAPFKSPGVDGIIRLTPH